MFILQGKENLNLRHTPEQLGIKVPVGPVIVKATFPGNSAILPIIDASYNLHGQWLTTPDQFDGGTLHKIIGPDGKASYLGILIEDGGLKLFKGNNGELEVTRHNDVSIKNLSKDVTAYLISRQGMQHTLVTRLLGPATYIEYHIILKMTTDNWENNLNWINPNRLISGSDNIKFGGVRRFMSTNWTNHGIPFDGT